MKEDTTKHTLNLIRGDVQRLQSLYPELGASAVIRTIVHNHVVEIEAKAKALPSNLETGVPI